MNPRTLFIAVAFLLSCTSLRAEVLTVLALGAEPPEPGDSEIRIVIAASDIDRKNMPICIPVNLPDNDVGDDVTVKSSHNNSFAGGAQITGPGLLSDSEAGLEIHFIVPHIPAGETLALTIDLDPVQAQAQQYFEWVDTSSEGEESVELRLVEEQDRRPVLRYMHTPFDTSTNESRVATYKAFHHVYDPTGTRYVTKGPGGHCSHHRGLFFGYNRIQYGDGKQADTWHCNKGEFQSHEEFLATEAGLVLGRHTLAIDWHGRDGEVFAKETREMTVYNLPDGILIEFASKLETVDGTVHLDGDPHHAGFQFRASQEVPDTTADQTYFLRPDGRGEPGEFRNWPEVEDHVNLPWNALSFVLGEQRYTCCYIDRPENPKEARFSERDYGRIGSYFQYDIEEDKPLELNYRIWLQEGEMEVGDVQAISDAFVHQPDSEAR